MEATYFVINSLVPDVLLFIHIWIVIREKNNPNRFRRRVGWNVNLWNISFYVELFK